MSFVHVGRDISRCQVAQRCAEKERFDALGGSNHSDALLSGPLASSQFMKLYTKPLIEKLNSSYNGIWRYLIISMVQVPVAGSF